MINSPMADSTQIRSDALHPRNHQIDSGARLHAAIARRKTVRALALIEAGADVHAVHGIARSTPLIAAASWGEASVCRVLIARGAKLEDIDRAGRTPLLTDLARKSEMFEEFLALGANAHAVDRAGENAFHRVCASGQFELMPRLRDLQVDAEVHNLAGQSPFALAIARGMLPSILGCLACAIPVDDAARAAVPPELADVVDRLLSINRLEAAAELDEPEFLWWVLSQGVDLEEAGPAGAKILAYAEERDLLRSAAVIRAWQFRAHSVPSVPSVPAVSAWGPTLKA